MRKKIERGWIRSPIFSAVIVGLLLIFIQAPSPQAQVNKANAEFGRNNFSSSIPDFDLTDQTGQHVRLYTDLIKGKVVVLSFFYTSCAFVCDVQGHNLAKLQARLGDRLGKDVFLISITRDPATDTPARLAKWAKEHGVRNGWTLVTGDVKDISKLVATYLSDTIGPVESHSATIYVGNDATSAWATSSGLAAPEELMRLIDRMAGPQSP